MVHQHVDTSATHMYTTKDECVNKCMIEFVGTTEENLGVSSQVCKEKLEGDITVGCCVKVGATSKV